MKFIDESKLIWRMYSTHAYLLTIGVAGGLAWVAKVHPELYAHIPGWALGVIGVCLAVTWGISRCVKQVSVSGDDNAAG